MAHQSTKRPQCSAERERIHGPLQPLERETFQWKRWAIGLVVFLVFLSAAIRLAKGGV